MKKSFFVVVLLVCLWCRTGSSQAMQFLMTLSWGSDATPNDTFTLPANTLQLGATCYTKNSEGTCNGSDGRLGAGNMSGMNATAGNWSVNASSGGAFYPVVDGLTPENYCSDGSVIGVQNAVVGYTSPGGYPVVASWGYFGGFNSYGVYLTVNGAVIPCTTNLVWNITNPQNSGGSQGWIAADNEGSGGPAAYSGYLVVDPGCTGMLMANGVPCNKAHNYSPVQLKIGNTLISPLDGNPESQGQAISGGDCGAASSLANVVWNNGCSICQNIAGTTCWSLNPTDFSGTPANGGGPTGTNSGSVGSLTSTNNPYNYTGGVGTPQILYNGTNGLSNAQQSADAIYAELVSAANQAHADQLKDEALIEGLGTNVGSGSSNEFVGLTNGLGLTNYAEESTLLGMSNLLADLATNGTGSNNFALMTWETNYLAAEAFVSSQLSGPLGQLNANKNNLNGPNYVEGQDSPGPLTFEFDSFSSGAKFGVMDFNPLHNPEVANMAAMIKRVFAWLLVLAYLTKVINDTIQALRALSAARSNGVPVMDVQFFGSGGNYAGVAMSVVCAGIAMVVWSVVLGTFAVWSVSGLDVFGTFNANPFAGAAPGALGMAEGFFPFAVMFELSVSYLVWRVSSSIVLATSLAILRIIFG